MRRCALPAVRSVIPFGARGLSNFSSSAVSRVTAPERRLRPLKLRQPPRVTRSAYAPPGRGAISRPSWVLVVNARDFRLDSVRTEAHDITTTDRLYPQASGGRETLPRSPPATRE